MNKFINFKNSQDSLTQQLIWETKPRNVFVIKKPCESIFESFNEIINYLIDVCLISKKGSHIEIVF